MSDPDEEKTVDFWVLVNYRSTHDLEHKTFSVTRIWVRFWHQNWSFLSPWSPFFEFPIDRKIRQSCWWRREKCKQMSKLLTPWTKSRLMPIWWFQRKYWSFVVELNKDNDVNIFKSMPTSSQDSIYRAEDDNLILGKIICFMICSLCLLCVMSL